MKAAIGHFTRQDVTAASVNTSVRQCKIHTPWARRALKEAPLSGTIRRDSDAWSLSELQGIPPAQSVMYFPPKTPISSICRGVSSGLKSGWKLRPQALCADM